MPEHTSSTATSRADKTPATILFGPTGTGKTPLGRILECRGLQGRHWRHLDFGEELRQAARGLDSPALFTTDERSTLSRILQDHRLLRDDELWIAERILKAFTHGGRSSSGETKVGVVLNGLPRNIRQAELVEWWFEPCLIVELTADADTILERLRTNRGGDRGDRTDDAPDAVRKKLDWYRRETEPLIARYRRAGCKAVPIPISPDTTPEETYAELVSRLAVACDSTGQESAFQQRRGGEPRS